MQATQSAELAKNSQSRSTRLWYSIGQLGSLSPQTFSTLDGNRASNSKTDLKAIDAPHEHYCTSNLDRHADTTTRHPKISGGSGSRITACRSFRECRNNYASKARCRMVSNLPLKPEITAVKRSFSIEPAYCEYVEIVSSISKAASHQKLL